MSGIFIASVLRSGHPLIPVPVGGADMPKGRELPPDLRDLSYRNAFHLRDHTWYEDLSRLYGLIDSGLPAGAGGRSGRAQGLPHQEAAARLSACITSIMSRKP